MNKPKPASVKDALNYRYFMDRLDNPALLDRAVITEDNDLAVPVGGKRRGGFCGAITRTTGQRTVRELAARPDDFPDARLIYVDGCGWLVEWGPGLDWRGDDAIAGRYYGYSEAAIAAFSWEQ